MKRKRRAPRARRAKQPAGRRGVGLSFEQLESRLAMAVVINEFLADNESGLTDFAGETQDWIELKNTGAVAENIGGWYLTDDSANLTKWQIPAGTSIAAGQHLVIFASSKNLTGAELHTNFSLSNNGEDLALVMSDGTTIADAFFDYAAQEADISYGSGVTDTSTTTVQLVNNSTPVKYLAPTGPDGDRDDHWRDIGYVPTGWQSGFGSVGKDSNGDAQNFTTLGWIDADSNIGSTMGDSAKTAYVRYEFNVTNKDQLTSLELDLRFDDGFIVYLNGREMKRANFGEDFANPQPSWNSDAGHQTTGSSAGGYNRGAEVVDIVHFDLTPYLEFLVEGGNVLAFHGVNTQSSSTTDLRDFLIQPTLTVKRANGALQDGFLLAPTPGGENGISYLGLVEDIGFSVDRGFYDTAQSVEITTATPGATIRYTTDGSVPTLTNGTTYSGAITVDPGLDTLTDGNRGVVTLRARAFKDGFLATNTDTQTYVFANKVIYQNGNGLPAWAPWGKDKSDTGTVNGFNLDDEADWAMDPDIVGGGETTQAVVNALKALPTVSLSMSWDDLFGGNPQPGTPAGTTTVAPNAQGIYIVGRSDERPASMEFFKPDGTASSQVDTVVEIQGHSSPNRWQTDKLSFQVKFKAPFGDSEWNQTLFGGTADGSNATTEFDTLILDAGFNYSFTHTNSAQNSVARYVTDQVLADLQNLASGGGDAPHGQWVHLYLDGVYWGIYNLHERPDDSFAAEYYGGDKDDYYIVKHASDTPAQHIYVEGGAAADAAFDNLLFLSQFVSDSSANDLAAFQEIAAVLDVDQFIDYMIVLYYGGNNVDWSNNNWYASFNHATEGGQWRFHAWDQEHAFPTNDNGDANTQTVNTTVKDQSFTPTWIQQNLMVNDEYRVRFSDRVQELMRNNGILTPTMAAAVYQARLTEIDQAIIAESARWGDNYIVTEDDEMNKDPYTRLDWLRVNSDPTGDGRAVLTDFFPTRTGTLINQFNAAPNGGWLSTLLAPNFSQLGGQVANGYQLTLTNPNAAGSIYYTTDGTDPRNEGGSIHGTLYTGPITISAETRIKTRVLNTAVSGTKNDWSPLVDRSFAVQADPVLGLRIVELMYNPASGAGDLEYFEILNTGTSTANLANVKITEFSSGGYTFTGGTLAPGERIVVVQSQAVFAAAYPGVTNVAAGQFSGSLANEGEIVSLRTPAGALIQSFRYGDSGVAGWPASPDGTGYSLVYVGPLDGNENPTDVAPADPFDDPVNWKASNSLGGSPGADDVVSSIPGDYDRLGSVDAADYALWKATYGQTVTPGSGADGNNNGKIDLGDYTVWRDHFGETQPGAGALVGGGGAAIDSSAVEEEAVDETEVAISNVVGDDRPSALGFAFIVESDSGSVDVDSANSGGGAAAVALRVDANLLRAFGDAENATDTDADGEVGQSAGDDELDLFDLAGVWDDESWVSRLGTGL